ncbi:metallophosphoesterase family protein [Cohnella terricola]
MRTLMISDIHGCQEPFDRLLQEIGYDSARDQLVLLGDYIDRGPRSKEVVERVMELVDRHGAVALRGNHDQRLVDLIRKDEAHIRKKFMEHGGRQTINSYFDVLSAEMNEEALLKAVDFIKANYGHHIEFLESLPYYYEDDSHICVHAGLNPLYSEWKKQPAHDFMYIKNDFIRNKTNVNKKVVFGHTRAVEIHGKSDIWFQDDKIGIDGGCAYGMQLNCLIFEDGAYTTRAILNHGSTVGT